MSTRKRLAFLRKSDDFEAKHPRADHGHFGSGGDVDAAQSIARLGTMGTKVETKGYIDSDSKPGDVLQLSRVNSYYKPDAATWPSMAAGDDVAVHDKQGWIYPAKVTTVDPDGDHATATMTGERTTTSMPVPQEEDGKYYIKLPNMSGHAHTRSWRTGDIVRLHDRVWQVKGAKPLDQGSNISYTLTPSTEEKWATRPGRAAVGSEREALQSVGSAIQTKTGEWLHVQEAKHTTFSGAIGQGRTFWQHGHYVSPEKATKINATHGPTLSRQLHAAQSTRVPDAMPADAKQLVPRTAGSSAASGERVALLGTKSVLWERAGDPDQSDSWRQYVSRVDDPTVVAAVKLFVRAHK